MARNVQPKSRRGYREGSITQRKNGLYVGRVRLGTKPDGSARTVQVTSMDWSKLIEKMDQAKAEYGSTGYIADKKTTMATWGEKWLTEIAAKKLGPNTYATHASLMRKWILPTIGRCVVSQLGPDDIRRVLTRMEHEGRSSTTQLQAYRVMSRCLEEARRNEITNQNVADRVDAPLRAATARGSFSVPEVKAIIAEAAKDRELGSRWVAQLFMGIRQGETLGLTWDCVDFDRQLIRVEWQLQMILRKHGCGQRTPEGTYPCGYKQAARCPNMGWQIPAGYEIRWLDPKRALALTRPKSRKGYRSVPMIPDMVAVLLQHRDRTEGAPNPHNLVWHNQGAPIDEQTDQEGWKTLLRNVGLPDDRTTHWARHSVATLLKAAGVDTLVIGEIVGHGSTAVTAGYIHISSELARDAMGRLGKALEA